MTPRPSLSPKLRNPMLVLAAQALCTGLSGCLMVGGYSSGSGGWFLFPGFGALVVIFIVLFLVRRRR